MNPIATTAANCNTESEIKDGVQIIEAHPRTGLRSIEDEVLSPGILEECGRAVLACCEAFFSSCNELFLGIGSLDCGSLDCGSLDCNCDCDI